MNQPRTLPARGFLLLMALVAALLLYRLGAVPLIGPDEPRYSRVAVEMQRSGDLVTPTLQGQPWLEKPVLYYWLAAAAFSALGENEAAARLPSALALLVTVACTAIVGSRLYGCRAGLLAGFATGTSLLMFAYGRSASMDMLLTASLTAGLGLLGLRRLGIAGPPAAVVGAAFLGLATLAKGPLGVLIPALVLVPHWLLTRKRAAAALVTPGAVVAFVLVALPWYALVTRAQGWLFVETFFLNHNVERFTSTVHNHPGPLLYYVPILLLGLFPWSVLLVPAVARIDRTSSADLFVAAWALMPLLFFSAAGSKLPGYILPVVPPLAILIGRASADLISGRPLRQAVALAAAGLALVLAVAVGAAPWLVRVPVAEQRVLLAPAAAWGALVMGLAAVRLIPPVRNVVPILRVGAAGFLLLIATAAPALLRHIESGRDLFVPAAQGREVLAWGAWRTAWMAGYFYNDGRVREVSGPVEIVEATQRGPVLVLCGPGERGRLETMPGVRVAVLATGVRKNALVEVSSR